MKVASGLSTTTMATDLLCYIFVGSLRLPPNIFEDQMPNLTEWIPATISRPYHMLTVPRCLANVALIKRSKPSKVRPASYVKSWQAERGKLISSIPRAVAGQVVLSPSERPTHVVDAGVAGATNAEFSRGGVEEVRR